MFRVRHWKEKLFYKIQRDVRISTLPANRNLHYGVSTYFHRTLFRHFTSHRDWCMEFPPEKTKTLSPRRRIFGPCLSLSFLKVFSCTKLLDGKSFPPSNTTIMFVHSQDITLPETQILNGRTFQYLSTNSKQFIIILLEAMRPTVNCGHFKHF